VILTFLFTDLIKPLIDLFVSDRVNAAIIAGHEEDVGKRTSVYVHTAHSLIQSLMLHKNRGFKQIPTDKVVLTIPCSFELLCMNL